MKISFASFITVAFTTLQIGQHESHAFAPVGNAYANIAIRQSSAVHASTSKDDTSSSSQLSTQVTQLKRILAREYATFFNPMETEYYAQDVTFNDPMTALSGVSSYQNNVDMLASRTLMGKALFSDAGIALHSITGGEIISDDEDGKGVRIGDITTRWTLKLTAKVLPWKPTARFSGISVYKVIPDPDPNSKVGVSIVHQDDYWDSVNIIPGSGGKYDKVAKGKAIGDFLDQLKPGGFQAKAAAPELPFELLRRGDGYEVRRYPGFTGIKLPYRRRDEGFGSLGAFTKGMSPLGPAIMDVQKDDISDKYMMWPLTYTPPGGTEPPTPEDAVEKAGEGQWRTMRVQTFPSKIVAVREFTDASMEPVVRKADRELQELLARDGLKAANDSEDLVRFAQYDAVFSMGRRRGEVWIDLDGDDNPWN